MKIKRSKARPKGKGPKKITGGVGGKIKSSRRTKKGKIKPTSHPIGASSYQESLSPGSAPGMSTSRIEWEAGVGWMEIRGRMFGIVL